ncbi:MAG: hypothetical protein KGJ55_00920 [Gammaproteobacteria bacterium]|nr:hypothetical protein [Gammaproteobacteria bacterium]
MSHALSAGISPSAAAGAPGLFWTGSINITGLQPFLCGDRFGVADIDAMIAVDIGAADFHPPAAVMESPLSGRRSGAWAKSRGSCHDCAWHGGAGSWR